MRCHKWICRISARPRRLGRFDVAQKLLPEYQGRPPFFRGRQVNFAVFIDFEEIFVSVERRWVQHAGDPPRIGRKSSFSGRLIQSRALTAGQIGLKFTGWVTESIWNKVYGVCFPGGVGKGKNSTFGLTWRGIWTSFLKLTLAPASSVSGLSSLQIWSCEQ